MARADVVGGNGFGTRTAAAGTAIRALLPPMRATTTRLTKLVYTAGATAHTLTALRSLGRTRATAPVAATGTVINLAANPGPTGNALAANDLLAIRETDGVTRLYTVSSITGLAVTLGSGLVAGVAANGSVWNFGVAGDTDPKTGAAHETFALGAGGATTFAEDNGGLVAGHGKDEPVLLSINNGTNAGTLNQTTWIHTRDTIPG